jgi:CRP/FNR family transcriptional regulator, cyclic AMP receptor protein
VLRAHCETLRFDAGATVLSLDATDRALLMVIDGRLAVYPRGKGRAARVLDDGAVVGELGFLTARPANARVEAATEVQLLRLTLQQFEALSAKEPVLALYVMFDLGRVLVEQLSAASAVLPTV